MLLMIVMEFFECGANLESQLRSQPKVKYEFTLTSQINTPKHLHLF